MKYSISNIAWDKKDDGEMYRFLSENKIDGIELAPTRVFNNPYDNLELAGQYAEMIKNKYNLSISSMQSIWYKITQNIFAGKDEQEFLLSYTKKAIDFAEAMDIKNLVFGCPINRNMPSGAKAEDAMEFFRQLGDYAYNRGTYLAIEANPVIYKTNFLNTTQEACDFCNEINSPGLKINIDFGTIIYNSENPHIIKKYKNIVNHIHLSAVNLEYVEKIQEHSSLKKVLDKMSYDKYLSIEMKNPQELKKVKSAVLYMKENF